VYLDYSRRGLYTFITGVLIQSREDIGRFDNFIRPTIDQKRDSVIFLTANQEALVQLKQLQGLRTKLVIESVPNEKGIHNTSIS